MLNAETFPFLAGIPAFALLSVIVALALWTVVIKGFALWHAARNAQPAWFIVLLVVNTLGVLEVAYLLAFRKDKRSYAAPAAAVAPIPPAA